MRLALTAALSALALAAPPAFGQEPLAGPAGTSLNKVLVIGTDGTRWDLCEAAIKAGQRAQPGAAAPRGLRPARRCSTTGRTRSR